MVNHKLKAHRGRIPKEQIWDFCIVETSFCPSRGFCCLVKNRSSETLLKIISDVVKEGSTIYSDEFKSDKALGKVKKYL